MCILVLGQSDRVVCTVLALIAFELFLRVPNLMVDVVKVIFGISLQLGIIELIAFDVYGGILIAMTIPQVAPEVVDLKRVNLSELLLNFDLRFFVILEYLRWSGFDSHLEHMILLSQVDYRNLANTTAQKSGDTHQHLFSLGVSWAD